MQEKLQRKVTLPEDSKVICFVCIPDFRANEDTALKCSIVGEKRHRVLSLCARVNDRTLSQCARAGVKAVSVPHLQKYFFCSYKIAICKTYCVILYIFVFFFQISTFNGYDVSHDTFHLLKLSSFTLHLKI